MRTRWKDNLQFNIKTKGVPRLINKDELDDTFQYDDTNIVAAARSYFRQDPAVWRLPAKNYFVRICLAYYVAHQFHENMYDLMNDHGLLPYDDAYSPVYRLDQATYDQIIAGIDIQNAPGYTKSIEVFGYLYHDVIAAHSLTLGYNLTGQEFFDTICFKKKYISEFFFSLTHTMPGKAIRSEDVIRQLTNANTYSIPGNLVLNTAASQDNWKELLTIACGIAPVRAATVLDISTAEKIKAAFPQLQIHISTHGAEQVNPEQLDGSFIAAVNVCEPYFYKSRGLLAACKEKGIKIKYIVNRGCIVGKAQKIFDLTGQTMECCRYDICNHLADQAPWMDLIRVDLYKESLQYFNVDLIKLSTRELNNEQVKSLLDYWTSSAPTNRLRNLPIHERNYDVFLEWVRQRYDCNGDCIGCMKCKTFYERILRG